MDNLNLLYVAFTRAKEGLIAFGKEPARDTEKNIGQLVYGFLNSHDHPFEEAWNGANFTIGKLKDISPHQDVSIDHEEVSLSGYQTFSWRKKMTIKKNAHKLTVKEDRKDRIEYGLLIHDLLARIKHKFHLPAALEELMQEGVINQDQRKELFEKVNSLFKIETINSWFTTDWEVKTEVPILPKSGEMRRLDRVMLQGDRAIIVDFKTGEQRAGDRDQVAAYRKLLSQMGFSSIQAFLLYIEDAKILEIT